MKYVDVNSIGRKESAFAVKKQDVIQYSQTFNKRSYTMFKSLFLSLVALFVVTGLAIGQNLVISSGGTFTGSTGVYNIKGSITNSGISATTTIPGRVNFVTPTVASPESVGTVGNGSITFDTLNIASTNANTTMFVNATASKHLIIAATGRTFDIGGDTLNVTGTSTRTSGTFKANSTAASTVNYNGASAQTAMQGTYQNLNFSAAGAKSLEGTISAATVTHAGGNLTVNQNLTVTSNGTFATIASIDSTLTLGTASSTVNTLTTVGTAGKLVNGSGALTVDNLAGNNGLITDATGNGGMTFTNAATNSASGIILGGSKLQWFKSTFTNGDSVLAGTGGVKFDGLLTNNGGIAANTNDTLFFNSKIANAAGRIELYNTGYAFMADSFLSSGTLSLATNSTWNYNGAGNQSVAGAATVTYGNLLITGGGTKTALGAISVLGNLDNGGASNVNVTFDMLTSLLSITGTKENTNSTIKFAGLSNGIAFNTGTVDYDGTTTDAATQTVGLGTYNNLQFHNNAPKNILSGTVTTNANLSIFGGVTANVQSTGILNVIGNLTNSGTLSNAGSVTVGN